LTAANGTNTTQSASGVQKSITGRGIAEGAHNWTVNCTDTATQVKQRNKDFTVDQTPPYINLSLPSEGSYINNNDVEFNWTATDYNGTLITCLLFVIRFTTFTKQR